MRYYNSISDSYIELHHKEQLNKIEKILKHLDITQNTRVMDLGCGPGFCRFDCEVYRVDPATQLLKYAEGRRVVASAEKLPFPDDFFDITVSITAIQNFRDIKKAISEMKRVCKGRFILSFLKKSPKAKELLEILKKEFRIEEIIEEKKDWIIIAS